MTPHAHTLAWFARHEINLAWRDWAAMMAGGRTARERIVTLFVLAFVAGLHWFAYLVLSPLLAGGVKPDVATLIVLTATMATTFSMMLSQAIEHVTRAFYARADLDLILSSPAPAQHLFAVRIVAIAATSALMTSTLIAPFINMAIVIDGPRWLAGYVVIAAMSAIATALALVASMVLFKMLGPKVTRLIAQITAAVVGASLIIALQIAAVLMYDNFSRMAVLQSPLVRSLAPAPDSLFWLPAHALLGDWRAALLLMTAAFAVLTLAIAYYAPRFSDHAVSAAGVSDDAEAVNGAVRERRFIRRSTAQALRHKEWMLLARDPWLMSQTLMQILYLIPAALLLYKDLRADQSVDVILAPVLVMAFGQLAGGLSWLALSGEDAHDLVATAPLSPRQQLRAKVEAVLTVIAAGSAPFVLALAFSSTWGALVSALGIALAGSASIIIQMWFKVAAKRSLFRRRQVASRSATFCEAFSSIFWAGAAGFAASESWFALFFVVLALLTLALARVIRPRAA
ncbi:MAG: permease [Hyphomicrobiaceae bacterium]|nr:permease [Hyphomicrobiaceae bacterium]